MSPTPIAPLAPAKPPAPQLNNLQGLAMMGSAFFLFATADMLAKVLTDSFHPVQIVWSRQMALLLGVVIMLAMKGPSIFRTSHPVLQIGRGMLAVVSATSFIFALRHVPLADAVAVSFVAPFLVTAMGALILGEKVGMRRWTAIMVGFIGTLIVIRPGPGLGVMHPAVVLVVIAATAFALRQIISRKLAASDKTATTVAYTSLASIVVLTIPLPFFWRMPEGGWEWGLLASVAVFAAFGELMVIKSLEIAEAAVLAPVHYSLLIWGVIWGWLIFGQLPDQWTWIGAALIMATGLYIINRERIAARKARASLGG